MLSFKTLIGKFKALSTPKKALLILVILIVVFGIVSLFMKSSFQSVSTTPYGVQTENMNQNEFDSFIALNYNEINLPQSTDFNVFYQLLSLVPYPSLDGLPESKGNLDTLNKLPESAISTGVTQINKYMITMNNLIKDITAVPVNVWNGSKTQKLLTGATANLKSNPNASAMDVANDFRAYQIAIANDVLSYLQSATVGNYVPLPPGIKSTAGTS